MKIQITAKTIGNSGSKLLYRLSEDPVLNVLIVANSEEEAETLFKAQCEKEMLDLEYHYTELATIL